MTKNTIFLYSQNPDAQKNFSTLPHLEKKLFFLQGGVANFFILIRKLRYNFFISQEAQVKNKIFYFFQDTWKKLFLSRIRLWNYFLMVKKFFNQLIPAQKYFLDGKMIFLKILSGVSGKNFLYPSVNAKICKNFESQVLR